MRLRNWCGVLFFLSTSLACFGQNWRFSSPWIGGISQVKINEKLVLHNDVHFIEGLFWANLHGLGYRVHKNLLVSGGYGFITTSTAFENRLKRYENRAWGQLLWQYPINENWRLQARFRYDARFRRAIENNDFAEGFDFNNRWRFQIAARRKIYQFNEKHRLNIEHFSELLLRSGQKINTPLDQWRNFTMLGWQTMKTNTLLGWHVRTVSTGNQQFIHNHGPVLWWIVML